MLAWHLAVEGYGIGFMQLRTGDAEPHVAHGTRGSQDQPSHVRLSRRRAGGSLEVDSEALTERDGLTGTDGVFVAVLRFYATE